MGANIKLRKPDATFGEISKEVARQWDALDDERKSGYKKKTENAKREYLRELAAYRASLVSINNHQIRTTSPLTGHPYRESFLKHKSFLPLPMSNDLISNLNSFPPMLNDPSALLPHALPIKNDNQPSHENENDEQNIVGQNIIAHHNSTPNFASIERNSENSNPYQISHQKFE